MNLRNTVALVTGAGHRLGRAIALGLAEAGCDLFIHYNRAEDGAREVALLIRALGRKAEIGAADLRTVVEIERLMDGFDAHFDRLDILVNSAASFERGAFDSVTSDEWDHSMALNLRAPFLLTQASAERMRRVPERAGTLRENHVPGLALNIADMSGVAPWRGFAAHGTSKAGLLHLTAITALELGPGVRANAIVPGPILPPASDSHGTPSGAREDWRRRGERLPIGRTGDPRQIAHAAVFLAENDYVTGTTVYVNGGEHLRPGGRS